MPIIIIIISSIIIIMSYAIIISYAYNNFWPKPYLILHLPSMPASSPFPTLVCKNKHMATPAKWGRCHPFKPQPVVNFQLIVRLLNFN